MAISWRLVTTDRRTVLVKYLRDKEHDVHKREPSQIKPQAPDERLRTPQERLSRLRGDSQMGSRRANKGLKGLIKG